MQAQKETCLQDKYRKDNDEFNSLDSCNQVTRAMRSFHPCRVQRRIVLVEHYRFGNRAQLQRDASADAGAATTGARAGCVAAGIVDALEYRQRKHSGTAMRK